jgi:hypothetical protein
MERHYDRSIGPRWTRYDAFTAFGAGMEAPPLNNSCGIHADLQFTLIPAAIPLFQISKTFDQPYPVSVF